MSLIDNSCVVYWIHKPEHTDYNNQGYIGITTNFRKRMQDHSRSENPFLRNIINKYGWFHLNKVIIVNDISVEEALLLEEMLRPKPIGWNLVKGGGKPPVMYGNPSTKGLTGSKANNYKSPVKGICNTTGKELVMVGPAEMRENGFTPAHIYAVLTGKRPHHKGFRFERIEQWQHQ